MVDGRERASISPEVKKRVETLLSQLTVEEKITLIGGIRDCQRLCGLSDGLGCGGHPESCRGRARQGQARRR